MEMGSAMGSMSRFSAAIATPQQIVTKNLRHNLMPAFVPMRVIAMIEQFLTCVRSEGIIEIQDVESCFLGKPRYISNEVRISDRGKPAKSSL